MEVGGAAMMGWRKGWIYICVCLCVLLGFFFCRRIFPSLDLQVDVFTSSKCPTRQHVRTVKIAAACLIAVISEACLYPDRNIALSRKWLLLCSLLDSKHSFAARLTLYAMLQTSAQLQKHSIANGNNPQWFCWGFETFQKNLSWEI